MAQNGDYPFSVYVWNRFTSSSVPTGTSIPTVNVQFNHYPNGGPEDENRQEPPPGEKTYDINPGDMIAFPLYWGPVVNDNGVQTIVGENLVITYPPNGEAAPKTPYYLVLGLKADYTLVDSEGNPLSLEGSKDYSLIPSGLGGKNSGIWTFTVPSFQWTLTVKKLIPDPETTNVSIGPDIP
jgi:hypothetical protein